MSKENREPRFPGDLSEPEKKKVSRITIAVAVLIIAVCCIVSFSAPVIPG